MPANTQRDRPTPTHPLQAQRHPPDQPPPTNSTAPTTTPTTTTTTTTPPTTATTPTPTPPTTTPTPTTATTTTTTATTPTTTPTPTTLPPRRPRHRQRRSPHHYPRHHPHHPHPAPTTCHINDTASGHDADRAYHHRNRTHRNSWPSRIAPARRCRCCRGPPRYLSASLRTPMLPGMTPGSFGSRTRPPQDRRTPSKAP